MDGIHDLGGKQGFGRVEREPDEPAFHARWEAAVFAIMRASGPAGAVSNTDQFRHAVERIEPRAYLDQGYYGRWIGGLETLLVEAGVLESAEIDGRFQQRGGSPEDLVGARPRARPDVVDYPPGGGEAQRELAAEPAFTVGDRVRTLAHGVPGHTRLPAYARARVGRVVATHDGWVYPDSNAHGRGEQPQHLYTVAFTGAELWGAGAEPGVVVNVDLFEPYLESADE